MALEDDGMLPIAALEKAFANAGVKHCPYAQATVCSWLKWVFHSVFDEDLSKSTTVSN